MDDIEIISLYTISIFGIINILFTVLKYVIHILRMQKYEKRIKDMELDIQCMYNILNRFNVEKKLECNDNMKKIQVYDKKYFNDTTYVNLDNLTNNIYILYMKNNEIICINVTGSKEISHKSKQRRRRRKMIENCDSHLKV